VTSVANTERHRLNHRGRSKGFDYPERLVRDDKHAWTSFPDLPGTHAWWTRPSGRSELVKRDGTVLCIANSWVWLTVAGRTYEMRSKGKRTTSLVLVPRELVDAVSGEQMLQIEGVNFNVKASGVVQTRLHRYTFPVMGKRRFALMTAVDETGHPVVHFRKAKIPGDRSMSRVEVLIAPDQRITPELACVIGVATPFLWLYFQSGGSGG